MDFELSEEHTLLKKLAREFATGEIMPWAERHWHAGDFPLELFEKMASLGFMGLLTPEEYGGTGAGAQAYVAIMEEISRGDQSLAASWNAHITIAQMPFLHFGTEEQKRKYLVPLARGEAFGAFGLTEPNAGSDVANLQCRGDLVGDQWVINGTKAFISNAGTPISWGVVALTTSGVDASGKKQYNCLIVPNGTPGYTVGRRYEKVGWHGVDTRELVFESCSVPRGNLLGEMGGGLRQFLQVLDVGRISVAALALGLAQRSYELALAHARTRVTFGKPISKHQAVAFKLADMAIEIAAARWLTYHAAWLYDRGRPHALEAAMAKLYASEAAVRIAEEAVQIHGGYGYIDESLVSRLYRDSKILTIGEGTSEIQRMVISRLIGC